MYKKGSSGLRCAQRRLRRFSGRPPPEDGGVVAQWQRTFPSPSHLRTNFVFLLLSLFFYLKTQQKRGTNSPKDQPPHSIRANPPAHPAPPRLGGAKRIHLRPPLLQRALALPGDLAEAPSKSANHRPVPIDLPVTDVQVSRKKNTKEKKTWNCLAKQHSGSSQVWLKSREAEMGSKRLWGPWRWTLWWTYSLRIMCNHLGGYSTMNKVIWLTCPTGDPPMVFRGPYRKRSLGFGVSGGNPKTTDKCQGWAQRKPICAKQAPTHNVWRLTEETGRHRETTGTHNPGAGRRK